MSGIYTLEEIQAQIAGNPERWRPLVFTNGCFDLLHTGHVRYLKVAKSWGKALIVGLNSDRSIKQIKPKQAGFPDRPIISELERAEVVASLKPVDGVIIFDRTTANQLIETLQPEIYVKGGDYTISTLPEALAVKAYGGKIKLVQVEIPTSTTAIISRIIQGSLL
jgi:rfaE bifunctional protein nucleotidyltransferase chain/domain